jgi:hypothetical protein
MVVDVVHAAEEYESKKSSLRKVDCNSCSTCIRFLYCFQATHHNRYQPRCREALLRGCSGKSQHFTHIIN